MQTLIGQVKGNRVNKNLSKLKWGGAILSGLIAYVVFFLTMAPTLSFWDCGEFIAAANILGIPHPPGTPFFVILGRVAIILMPWVGEIAARVNLVSVISSALAVFFSYLVVWEVLEQWLRSRGRFEESSTKWVLPIGGLVAAFLVAFSDTFWFNAVEAEVYGTAMGVVFLVTWLSLVWLRKRGTLFGDRLLILICYIAFLGIGIQLYTLITLPALFAFVLMADPDLRKKERFPFWIAAALLYSVVYRVESFPEIAFTLFVVTAIALLITKMQKNTLWARTWRLSFWMVFVAVLGYSTHAYIPIRSALDPVIDENDPEMHLESITDLFDQDKWGRFNDFLARKQYGSESMVTRAFHRRAHFDNQLLTWPHMGFGGYQFAQYLPWKVGEVRFGRERGQWAVAPEDNPPTEKLGISFPTQMMLFNDNIIPQLLIFLLFNGAIGFIVWRLWKSNKTIAVYIAALYLTTTGGLLLYMNFADGLGSEKIYYDHWIKSGSPPSGPQTVQLEVRERDYFFTPGFMLMGVIFGMGAGMAVEGLWRRRGPRMAKGVGVALAAVSFVVPLGTNYREHDRSGDFIPWDYAYNLINSCGPNGILFTNGDNDTFPLWFIQEVENIRKDVRVVNLSLGNTDWYIRQILENEPKLRLNDLSQRLDKLDGYDALIDIKNYPVDRSISESDSLLQEITSHLSRADDSGFKDSVVAERGEAYWTRWLEVQQQNLLLVRNHRQMFVAMKEWLSNYHPNYLKVQDQLVMDLMLSNPERPLHFATTVGRENFVGLDRYMDMQGMVFTLRRFIQEPQGALDIEQTRHLVENVYQFRCIEDKSCHISDETLRLLYNYNTIYFRLLMEARRELATVRPTLSMIEQTESDSLQASTLSMMKEDLERREKEAMEMGEYYLRKSLLQFPQEWRSRVIGADFYIAQDKIDEAIALLEEGLKAVPSYDRVEIEERLSQLRRAMEVDRGPMLGNP